MSSVASDLRFYDAIPGAPIGVAGSPIIDDGRVVGALMMSYDAGSITDLVTADETWEKAGLPETGDVYVIGADGLTRSDPRAFLEDPTSYLDATEAARGLSAEERVAIEATGTTVLTQQVVDETRDAGLEGDREMRESSSITGVPVLGVIVPVESESVEWYRRGRGRARTSPVGDSTTSRSS